MRFGPILVPVAIVVSIGVIVGAESGWFDGPVADPVFIHAEAGVHGAPPGQARQKLAAATAGRSIRQEPARRPVPAPVAEAAKPVAHEPPASPDALEQARREAEKAKQDVVDVTQASIAAQGAAESEMARQKADYDGRIAQLQAKLDADDKSRDARGDTEKGLQADLAAARGETDALKRKLAARGDAPDVEALRQRAAATAQAEAAAATATAELADARTRENALRQTLAGLQGGAADKAAEGRAQEALATARDRAKALEDQAKALDAKVAALTERAAAGDAATRQLGDLQRQLAEARQVAQAKQVVDAKQTVASKVATPAADGGADPAALADLRDTLAGARRGEATLRQENAVLQRELAEARQARTKASDQVADAGGEPQDGRSVADERSAVALAAALRTAETELARLRAVRAHDATQLDMLHRLLSNLGPPRQQGARIVRVPDDDPRPARRARNGAAHSASADDPIENKRLSDQLGSLQREQMHMELQALKKEAAAMARARN